MYIFLPSTRHLFGQNQNRSKMLSSFFSKEKKHRSFTYLFSVSVLVSCAGCAAAEVEEEEGEGSRAEDSEGLEADDSRLLLGCSVVLVLRRRARSLGRAPPLPLGSDTATTKDIATNTDTDKILPNISCSMHRCYSSLITIFREKERLFFFI